MYCHQCGAKLPDNAKFCPECGEKTVLDFSRKEPRTQPGEKPVSPVEPIEEEPGEGFCLITRKTGTGLRKTTVSVDGAYMGELKDGETLPLTLTAGEHTLSLRTGRQEKMTSFAVGKGDTTIIHYRTVDGALDRDRSGHKVLKCELIPHTVGVPNYVRQMQTNTASEPISTPSVRTSTNVRLCPRCNGPMMIQTVAESRKTGCGTVLLYIILCLTILGILIVIPLALRKKTETVTYAVCQNCGYRERRFGRL